MRLIGVTGRMGSGKDTTFDFIATIAAERDQVAVRQAFADKLKVSAARALGFEGLAADAVELCNLLKVEGRIVIETDELGWEITGREFLQWYGTEAHREVFDTDFWVDALLPYGRPPTQPWRENFPGADYAVITDVRFPNEAQRILDLGGEVWRIDADERLGANGETHASEALLPPEYITHTLNNNSPLRSNLGEQIRGLLSC